MTDATASRLAYDLADPTSMILDLVNPKPKDVLAIHETFRTAMRANPDLGPLPVSTGWMDITPAIAINLLQRNHPGTNRWLNPAAVFYYARQMAADEWMPTGQPVLINVNDELKDAQHRMYAVVISGKTIRTYVITDIADIPNLFVYIDNIMAVRGATAALQTAGYNGTSPTIAKVLRFAEEVRLGIYSPAGNTRLARTTPAQVLNLIGHYPTAQNAAQSAATDWAGAAKYLGNRKDIVAYVGMRIIDVHGEEAADEFFADAIDDRAREPDHPITALRKEMDKNNRQLVPMKRQSLAANLILAFNAWATEASLGRRWLWNPDTEPFPDLVEAEPQAQAAE
jgi:hypothetical protein